MSYNPAIILIIFLWSITSIMYAQDNTKDKSNVNVQPAWGPTGYDYVKYYYLPDIDVYYYVPQHLYYYSSRGHWFYSSYLPARFSNYDIFLNYKVVMNKVDPWQNAKNNREEYSAYKNRHNQLMIRDSREVKYFQNENHPEHKNKAKQDKPNNDMNKLNK